MPTYQVTNKKTGQVLTLDRDSAPADEEELQKLFASAPPPPPEVGLYQAGYAAAGDPVRTRLFYLSQLWNALRKKDPNQESFRQAGFNAGKLDKANVGTTPVLTARPWEQAAAPPNYAVRMMPPPPPPPTPSSLGPQPAAGAATGELPTEQAWREAQRASDVQSVINQLYGMHPQ